MSADGRSEFEQHVGRVLDESVTRISGHARSRLNQARLAALEEIAARPRSFWRLPALVPAAGAVAAVAVVAVVLMTWPGGEHVLPGGEGTYEDIEMLSDNDGLDLLRDRIAAMEALKKDIAAIEVLREKVASLTADLKVARDDSLKMNQELEKNRAADMERKSARDSQARQIDETLKELQKGLQDCREKLARLEGMQPAGPPPPKPNDKAAAK